MSTNAGSAVRGQTNRWSPHLILALLASFLAVIAIARIASTYSVFNQTFDEPAHIAAGMEWLELGSYTYELLHPPVARVAVAMVPFLAGVRLSPSQRAIPRDPAQHRAVRRGHMWTAGTEILQGGGRDLRNLTLARIGVLPFVLLALFLTWRWGLEWYGPPTAFAAVLLLSTTPAILGHGGLATTDMPLTAAALAGLFALALWLESPSWTRTILVGATWGLAAVTKFSALFFLPTSALAVTAWYLLVERYRTRDALASARHRTVRRLARVAAAAVVACFIVWGGYRFALAPLTTAETRPHTSIDHVVGSEGFLHDVAYAAIEAPLPLSGFVRGIQEAANKNEDGHESFLLGEYSSHGWWYFFPVILAIKTPIGFLVLAAVGAVVLLFRTRRERDWRLFVPCICGSAVLLVGMLANLNLGSRHVLLVYPLGSIAAGYGAVHLWCSQHRRLLARSVVIAALGWHLVSTTAEHPDYLAYFNELARSAPEEFVVDSDLDWGQDLMRLSEELRRRGVRELSLAYHGSADLSRFDLPPFRRLEPHTPTSGWIAISLVALIDVYGPPPHDAYEWLEAYEPVTTVGRSIRLYHITQSDL